MSDLRSEGGLKAATFGRRLPMRAALEAWRNGDFDTIEEILDPNVEWRALEPGEYDRHDRNDVMRI
jgi:hypothetical protein